MLQHWGIKVLTACSKLPRSVSSRSFCKSLGHRLNSLNSQTLLFSDSPATSSTQWTWVWVDSGSWWWTGRPGVLQSLGSQRIGHDWATELNWTEPHLALSFSFCIYIAIPELLTTSLFTFFLLFFPFIFKILKYLFIYLPVLGLSHSTQDPWSSLWHAGYSSLTRDQTQEFLHWEHGVLATGPPEKSILFPFK